MTADDESSTRRGCPVCGHEGTGSNSLENGQWSFEPVENFGIEDADEGMVCAEWNADNLWSYYHSPTVPDSGPVKRAADGGSR
jgi:hypothetical protein